MDDPKDRATQLFLSKYNLVLGLACRHAPFPGIADDILQDVFVEFVQNADRWNLEENIEPILVRLTRFAVASHWRERLKSRPSAMQKLAEHLKSIAETNAESVDGDEMVVLRHCLGKLAPKSRELIDLHYKENLSMVDIARKMAVTDLAVRQAVCRIRGVLRLCMRKIRGEA